MTAVTPTAVAVGMVLPPLTIEATPPSWWPPRWPPVISRTCTTIGDLAHQKGSKDIFVNILTDTGLVERFVTDWAGPSAYHHQSNSGCLVRL